MISAVSHKGLTVPFDSTPARPAIATEDRQAAAAGNRVAREARAVAANCYGAYLQAKGHLRVFSKRIEPAVQQSQS